MTGKKEYKSSLRPKVNIVLAAALLIGSLVVCFPAWFDFSVPWDATRYLPFGIYLVLDGALLYWGARELRALEKDSGRSQTTLRWLGSFLVLGTGIIDILLAGNALMSFDAKTLWIALLALPGVAAWGTETKMMALYKESKSDAPPGKSFLVQDRETFWQIIGAYVLNTIRLCLILAGILVLFYLGGVVFGLLKAILFEGGTLNLANIQGGVREFFKPLLPTLAGTIVAIGGLNILFGLGHGIYRLFMKSEHRGFTRKFEKEEDEFLEECLGKLHAYVSAKNFPRYFPLLYFGSFGLMFVLIVGYVFIVLYLGDWSKAFFEPDAVAGLKWYLYLDDFGVAGLLLLFALLCLAAALGQLLPLISPRFAEYAVIKGGFRKDNSFEARITNLDLFLKKCLRKRKIAPYDDFSPEKFLKIAATGLAKPLWTVTAILFIFVGFFWYHDHKDYDLLTPAYIETVDYWTLEATRTPYSEVSKVAIKCYTSDKHELQISYRIYVSDETSLNIIKLRDLRDDFGTYRKIDELLTRNSVPFEFPNKSGWFNKGEPGINDSCLTYLMKRYGSTMAADVLNLLHLKVER